MSGNMGMIYNQKILEMIWRDIAKLNKLDALQLFYSKLQS